MCRNYPFFANLPAELRRAAVLRMARPPLRRKRALHRQGEQAAHVHRVAPDPALPYRRAAGGRRGRRGMPGPGRLIGEQALVRETRRFEGAEAREAGVCCPIAVQDRQAPARCRPVLHELPVRYPARRLRKMERLTLAGPHERPVASLHRLMQRRGERIATSRQAARCALDRPAPQGIIAGRRRCLQVM